MTKTASLAAVRAGLEAMGSTLATPFKAIVPLADDAGRAVSNFFTPDPNKKKQAFYDPDRTISGSRMLGTALGLTTGASAAPTAGRLLNALGSHIAGGKLSAAQRIGGTLLGGAGSLVGGTAVGSGIGDAIGHKIATPKLALLADAFDVADYKPFNSLYAGTVGIPLGAAAGGLVGAGVGALRSHKGHRAHDIGHDALIGAGLGAGTALAAPSLFQGSNLSAGLLNRAAINAEAGSDPASQLQAQPALLNNALNTLGTAAIAPQLSFKDFYSAYTQGRA